MLGRTGNRTEVSLVSGSAVRGRRHQRASESWTASLAVVAAPRHPAAIGPGFDVQPVPRLRSVLARSGALSVPHRRPSGSASSVVGTISRLSLSRLAIARAILRACMDCPKVVCLRARAEIFPKTLHPGGKVPQSSALVTFFLSCRHCLRRRNAIAKLMFRPAELSN